MNEKTAQQSLAPKCMAARESETEQSDEREIWLSDAIAHHERMLVRYAQQFVVDLDRARDVVQDTFLKLCDYDRCHSRLEDKSLTKWLFRVCRNRAIDVVRKEKRMKSASSEEFEQHCEANERSPEAAMLAEERQSSLLMQIEQLTTNQQEVLRLKFHGGMSYQEIADITGLTKTNVGYLLHTAISKLRDQIS